MTAHFADNRWNRKENGQKRVVITGIGAVTPLGNTVKESWHNLVAGESGIAPITLFDASQYPVKIAAEVKNFDFDGCVPEDINPYLGRGTKFCIHAVKEALEHARLDLEKQDTSLMGIALGSDEEGAQIKHFEEMFDVEHIRDFLEARRSARTLTHPYPHLLNSKLLGQIWPIRRSAHIAANIVSILFNIKGPISTSASACASSAQAVGKAMRTIQDGDADIMITGGCDSMIGEFHVSGFNRLRALSRNNDNPEKASRPFDLKRDGFILGEGAGILVLEELSHAKKRNANIIAELAGYGSSSNAYRLTASPEDGQGVDICMKTALRDAGCTIEDVDYINAHGTSTYLNDKSETAAIKNVFQDRAYEIPISSNKSMLGHLIASAASIELIISALTINENVIPPTINYEFPDPECDLDYVPNVPRKSQVDTILSNSFAFGGQNASVLLKRFQ